MGKRLDPSILQCPACGCADLDVGATELACTGCDARYAVRDGAFVFRELASGDISDSLDRIKHAFKRLGKLYTALIHLVSPVFWHGDDTRFIRENVEGKNVIAINVGSGNSDLSPHVSNADVFAYENVDLTCDIASLPLRDASVDVILNIAVLEHVPDPEKVVAEIHRVLKPGGLVFSKIPFMQGFHASPYDFSRRTWEGMKVLYADFDQVSLACYGGPTSGFLWMFQEWVAIAFSFGIKPLHTLIYLVVMMLTWPLKFLDALLIHHPQAKNISSGFTYVGRKAERANPE